MIQKTGMTIDEYLRNAGTKSVNTTGHKNSLPLKILRNPTFPEDLAAAISANPPGSVGKPTGLTISDYLNQAATRPSTGFFKNTPMRNGSLTPGSRNIFSNAFVPLKEDPMTTASAVYDNSTGAASGDTIDADNQALIADSIKKAAKKYNLSEKLIESVIQAESNFQVDAVSPAGAQGLMQLMPATAKELGVVDPFDIRQNIDGGVGYLRRMLDRFDGDVSLALAAYNAGPGTVERYNGNVPYRETQKYVERVLKRVSV